MENNNEKNQNEQNQGEKKRKGFSSWSKRKKVIIICIAAFALLSIGMRGFGGYGRIGVMGGVNRSQSRLGRMGGAENITGFLQGNLQISGTDNNFTALGIIFVETTAGAREGYGITYTNLMREASLMGGDGIINVNIFSDGRFFNRTWTGTALAIRYTDSP